MPRIDGNYLDISDCNINLYKIFSSKFGGLVGQDDFNKRGDIVLKMFKIINEPFDEFYKWRGDSAEEFVYFNISSRFKDLKWYGETVSLSGKKTFDMFNNEHFGAVLDFTYTDYIENETISLEIKSKNIKDYEKIQKNGAQNSHIAQAELAAYLGGYKKFNILYIFFTDEQEQMIKEAKESVLFSENELKIFMCRFEVNEEKIKLQMNDAWEYCFWVSQFKKIPLQDISEKSFKLLGIIPPDSGFAFRPII